MKIPTKLSASILAFKGLQKTFIDSSLAAMMILFGDERHDTINSKIDNGGELNGEEKKIVGALDHLARSLHHAMEASVMLGVHLALDAKVLSRNAFENPDAYDEYVADETKAASALGEALIKEWEKIYENENNRIHGKKV